MLFLQHSLLLVLYHLHRKQVTFEAGKDLGTGLTVEKEGITITISLGVLNESHSYRLYKGATTTIGSSSTNIINVDFICDKFKYGKKTYLGDGFDSSMTGLTISDDKINVTWSGDNKSVAFETPNHQVRVKKITVTLKSDPAGIKEVNNDTVNENAPIYNLAGQRVGKDYKGVVIQNGKKFIKK